MMKKVLVLLTVLATTSVASAVTTVDLVITSLNGEAIAPVKEITIGESDTINFDIVYSTTDQKTWLAMDVIVSVEGPGTLDITQYTIPEGWDPGFHYEPREIIPGKSYEFGEAQFNGYAGPILLDHLLLHGDQLVPPYDFLVSVGPGSYFGGSSLLPDYSLPDEWVGIVVHIPEPVTVVLVGLGGLLLVRRRR